MKKHLLPLLSLLLMTLGCLPNAQEENKFHHKAELQYDLWKEDTIAREQVFSLREDTVSTIVCEGGTKLLIPAHAFVPEEDPAIAVKGVVELRVLEVYQPAAMLRHSLSTQEKVGKLLESAGMLYLEAYAEGKKLRLKEGKEILLGFPKKEGFREASLSRGVAASGASLRWEREKRNFDLEKAVIDTYFGGDIPTNIRLVTAEEALAESHAKTATNKRKTRPIDPNSYPRVLAGDEAVTEMMSGLLEGYNDYFFFSTPRLGWANCDRLVEEEVSNLIVDISGFPQNTLYYLVFEELNSLMEGYRKVGMAEETNPVFEQVPLGRQAKLIVIFHRGGTYYLARQDLLTAEGQTIALKPEATTKEEIRAYLQSLGTAEGLSASR